MLPRLGLPALLAAAALTTLLACAGHSGPHHWSPEEREMILSLSLDSRPPLPPDPSNRVGDDPEAAALGHHLFFDTRLSLNGEVACATCHQPDKLFTDGKVRAEAIGTTRRHTPSILGAAYSPWQFWDGRKDTQWSQALGPLEDAREHAASRTFHAWVILERYREEYESLFGPMPDLEDADRFPPHATPLGGPEERAAWESMSPGDRRAVNTIFANLGKSIAAYERRIQHGRARFDDYAAALAANDRERMARVFSEEEAQGLRLFLGRAQCFQCHGGFAFTNHDFHNTALPPVAKGGVDEGRIEGVRLLQADPFNCLSELSDAGKDDCRELRFLKSEGTELVGAMKTPSLRNVAETPPYMHSGQFETLRQVLDHYNQPPEPIIGHTDLKPLELDPEQLDALEAFLRTLSAPPDAPEDYLAPPADLEKPGS